MRRYLLPVTLSVAILAPIAWWVTQNLRLAMNRSHQKRTMADIRTIATAWEGRATDLNSYTIGARHGTSPIQRVSTADLARALEPKYVRHMPRVDGWDNEFEFTMSDFDEHGQAQSYAIRAIGSDHRADRIATLGATTDFAADIIYSDGTFTRFPEGVL